MKLSCHTRGFREESVQCRQTIGNRNLDRSRTAVSPPGSGRCFRQSLTIWPTPKIAATLGISVRTVESHVSNLLTKFEVSDRSGLVAAVRAHENAGPVRLRLPLHCCAWPTQVSLWAAFRSSGNCTMNGRQ